MIWRGAISWKIQHQLLKSSDSSIFRIPGVLGITLPRVAFFQPARQIHQGPQNSGATVSYRKELKEQRAEWRKSYSPRQLDCSAWELAVGIEIHAELDTQKKLFSTAFTSHNDEPNTNIALFDLAYPGAQPVFQQATVIPAIRAALALNCEIQRKSSFDRKHYFYPDQPAGYQITQYYEPFAKNGHITLYRHDGIDPADGDSVVVRIKQIQLEQDTAKSLTQSGSTLLDFNRVSHPLIEIITLPDIHHPATAAAYVRKVQSVLNSVGAVTAGIENGGLRADVNVSVRKRSEDVPAQSSNSYHGVKGLGQRTEIKNLSSFKAVAHAVTAERDRQICTLDEGGIIVNETRGWTIGETETRRLRGKEGEVDYRYMPDPDLGPLVISESLVKWISKGRPATADETLHRLMFEYGLSQKDAQTFMKLDDGDRMEYLLDVVHLAEKMGEGSSSSRKRLGQRASAWILHRLGGLFNEEGASWDPLHLPAEQMAEIVHLLDTEVLTADVASRGLRNLFKSGSTWTINMWSKAIEAQERASRLDRDECREIIRELIQSNMSVAHRIVAKGDDKKKQFFIGQTIKLLRKREKTVGGNAPVIGELLEEELKVFEPQILQLKSQHDL